MALQETGAISASDINTELFLPSSTLFSFDSADSRTLSGISSGAISMSDFYGKEAAPFQLTNAIIEPVIYGATEDATDVPSIEEAEVIRFNSSYIVVGSQPQSTDVHEDVIVFDRTTKEELWRVRDVRFPWSLGATPAEMQRIYNWYITESYLVVAGYAGGAHLVRVFNLSTQAVLRDITLRGDGDPLGACSVWGDPNGTTCIIGEEYYQDANYNQGYSNQRGVCWVVDVSTGTHLGAIHDYEFNTYNYYSSFGDIWMGVVVDEASNQIFCCPPQLFGGEPATGNTAGLVKYTISPLAYVNHVQSPFPADLDTSASFFGYGPSGIVLDGSKLLIGAFGAMADSRGEAYIYDTSTLSRLHTFSDPNPRGTTNLDRFGRGVCVTPSYYVISAINEYDSTTTYTYTGAVYVYAKSNYAYLREIDIPFYSTPTTATSRGRYLPPYGTDTSVYNTSYEAHQPDGNITVYEHNPTTGTTIDHWWVDNLYLDIRASNWGHSVACTNTEFAVCAHTYDDLLTQQGVVTIFDIATRAPKRSLFPLNFGTEPARYSVFGMGIAYSDSYFVASAPYSNATNGYVNIYNLPNYDLAVTINNDGTYFPDSLTTGGLFGTYLDCNDTYVVIAYHRSELNGTTDAGSIHVFTTAGAFVHSWVPTAGDYFRVGEIKISGDYAVIGTVDDINSKGNVNLYHIPTNTMLYEEYAVSGTYLGTGVGINSTYFVYTENSQVTARNISDQQIAFTIPYSSGTAQYTRSLGVSEKYISFRNGGNTTFSFAIYNIALQQIVTTVTPAFPGSAYPWDDVGWGVTQRFSPDQRTLVFGSDAYTITGTTDGLVWLFR